MNPDPQPETPNQEETPKAIPAPQRPASAPPATGDVNIAATEEIPRTPWIEGIRPEFGGYAEYLTISELAHIWRVSTRRIGQYVERGIIPRQAHGQYHLLKCSVAYIQNREKIKDLPADPNAPLELSPRDRLNRVQADRQELKLRREQGALIPLETYRQALTEDFQTVRERLNLIPQLAGRLAGEPREKIEEILAAEIRNVLTSLSHGDGHPDHARIVSGPDADQAPSLPTPSAPEPPQGQ